MGAAFVVAMLNGSAGNTGRGISVRASRCALGARLGGTMLLAALLAGCWPGAVAAPPALPRAKDPDVVRVSNEHGHQVAITQVEPFAFRLYKPAIGQIAFNEDASTVVFTPFSGRVTRLFAKIGDEVRRGDQLFEIDSPEVVQAQTDLIAALHGLEKARSNVTMAERQAERMERLMANKATS